MAEKLPNKEFGKCQPQPLPLPPKEPVKHSGHVALLVMGTIAVGTTACALMPRPNCDPPAPGMAAPAQAQCGVLQPKLVRRRQLALVIALELFQQRPLRAILHPAARPT